MVAEFANTTRLREVGEKGMALLGAHAAGRREWLSEMTDFFAYLKREIPVLMRRFHDERESGCEIGGRGDSGGE